MKRIFISLFLVLTVGIAMVVATRAVWSESQTFQSNSATMAQVNFHLENLSGVALPMSLTKLMPGVWSDPSITNVVNSLDSAPIRMYFYVDKINPPTGAACDKVDLYLTPVLR